MDSGKQLSNPGDIPVSTHVQVARARGAEPTAVSAPLNFIVWQETKPYFHSALLTGDKPEFFFETEARTVNIQDLRALDGLTVDREGFELLQHASSVRDLYDDDAVKKVYYPELEALLLRRFAATRVVIFDSTRRSDRHGGAANPDGARRPAAHVHVDYTVDSGPKRVRDLLGEEEAERLERGGTRIRQINVWRPIRGPVERSPLAIADASSIAVDDLIATDQIFPDRVGEIYHLAYRPSQRWFYAPRMTPHEALLIKGWDSLAHGPSRFTPHTAFELPNTPPTARPRESIETRTLVIG
jgi:hypothetical protein